MQLLASLWQQAANRKTIDFMQIISVLLNGRFV
jgi:hypothetical protein